MKIEGQKQPITLGVEFTYLPPHMIDPDHFEAKDVNEELSEVFSKLLEYRLKKANIKHLGVAVDCHCIEINSPPFNTAEDMLIYRENLDHFARQLKLIPHADAAISGGGHLNYGGLDDFTIVHLARDISQRPYIAWAFNDPCDNLIFPTILPTLKDRQAAEVKSFTSKKRPGTNLSRRVLQNYNTNYYIDVDGVYCRYHPHTDDVIEEYDDLVAASLRLCNRDAAIRYRTADGEPLLEYRFFEAARNQKEQADHVDFGTAYIQWITDRNDIELPEYWAANAVEKNITYADLLAPWTLKRCQKEFMQFIGMLGLDKRRYKIYSTRNLAHRFELKTNNFNSAAW